MPRAGLRLVRFNLVGLAGVAVQIGALVALADWGGVRLEVAAPVAVALAVAHNFVWHIRWTWADRGQRRSRASAFVRFAAGNGAVSIVGNTLLVPLLAGRLGMPTSAAALIAIAACGLLNFLLADRLVFVNAARVRPGRGSIPQSSGPSSERRKRTSVFM